MNIQEYISSGILEAYVLGTLSEEENEKVSKEVASNPELKKELAAIEEALYKYAQSHSKNPPKALKEKLLNKIDEVEGEVVYLPEQKSSVFYYLAAASIIVAIFSASFAIYFWSKWKQAERQILAMEQQNATVAQNVNLVNKLQAEVKTNEVYISSLKKDLTIALDSGTHIVPLKGLPLSPTASAVVLWNVTSNDVFIDVKNLPAPPSDKQYQLWALHNGKPIDAGIFDVSDSTNLQRVKNIEAAEAFAVTLEKKGGSPSPTMDAMYLMGKL